MASLIIGVIAALCYYALKPTIDKWWGKNVDNFMEEASLPESITKNSFNISLGAIAVIWALFSLVGATLLAAGYLGGMWLIPKIWTRGNNDPPPNNDR